MKKSIYKNDDELPLFLNAKTLAEVLGIATSSAEGKSWRKTITFQCQMKFFV